MIIKIASLYKRGRGKILAWEISVITENNKVAIKTEHGILDMGMSIEWQRNIKGSNIGKVNEFTPYERAIQLAEGKANNKRRLGYKSLSDINNGDEYAIHKYPSLAEYLEETLPKFNTDIEGNEIPMKCQQYYKSKKDFIDPYGVHWEDRKYYYIKNPYANPPLDHLTITFPVIVQPKVNGVRCFAKRINGKTVLYSKKGLEYNLPHISEWLDTNSDIYLVNGNEVILDGELYIPGESLGTIVSAVKAMQLITTRVEYHLFDIAVDDMTQIERTKNMYTPERKQMIGLNSPIKLVRSIMGQDNNKVQELTDEFIKEGYEGSIQREPKAVYSFGGRPKTITKLKRTISAEFKIIDVIGQEKDDTLGMFVCMAGNEEFKVTAGGSNIFKQSVRLQPHLYIGKDLTIVFYEYTDKGIPFHIIDTVIRDYE